MTPDVEVLQTGPLATVQDLGRPGLAHLGVGTSGAADRRSLQLANRLVGNPESAAGIEVTLGGLVVRFGRSARVAVTGASCPMAVAGQAADPGRPVSVLAGEVLELGPADRGLRTYLAVDGGIAVPRPVLGSRATDTMARMGPDVLAVGTRLPLGDPAGPRAQETPQGEALDIAQQAMTDDATLRILLGPRNDWFTDEAVSALCSRPFTVTSECNRIGMRLDGPALARQTEGELKSEATVLGALQVPPNGRPILFLADHPVTGGYPVVAVVAEDDVAVAAQLRPGATIRFHRL